MVAPPREEETEAHRGEVTCPQSHCKAVVSLAKAQSYPAPYTSPRIQHPRSFLVLSGAVIPFAPLS